MKISFKSVLKWLLHIIIILFLVGVICVVALFIYANSFSDNSTITDIDDFKLNFATVIYAKDNKTGEFEEIERLHSGENRIWVGYGDVPENLRDAFVAIEDKRFYTHGGVDWKRTAGAVVGFLTGNDSYGGSTITQQFIKNITGDKKQTPARKIREIVRALQLERKLEKEEILELYLNTSFMGQNYYGVQSASNGYFGKDVKDLTLAECASLAGITNLPTKYNPLINPEENKNRQKLILKEMLSQGLISQEEHDEAVAQELVFKTSEKDTATLSKQSYYVDQIITTVINDLQQQKGYSKQAATDMIYAGGLKIYSLMDQDVQKAMDDVFSNTANFPTLSGSTQPEASMVILDPKSGDVAALYGGRGPKTADRVLNRAVQTKRSPGSTIKPIAVYAPAIENGVITAGSVADDTPFKDDTKYPKNYYSGYKGLVTVQYAIEQSINTVAVKVLDQLSTDKSFIFLQNNLKVSSLVADDKNIAPLALGGLTNGISVLELAASYVPFDDNGTYHKPRLYSKIEDSTGQIILENKPEASSAMSEETAFIMNKMLQSVVTNGTGTPAKLKGGSQPAAGKTGTTDDDTDRWFVGFTPYYVGTVWFGYDTPKTVSGVSTNPALSLWKKVMEKVHADLPNQSFASSHDNVVTAQYCKDSGKKPGSSCSLDPRGGRTATGYFKKGTEPSETCDSHYVIQVDSETGQRITDFCPEANKKSVAYVKYPRTWTSAGDSAYVVRTDSSGKIIGGLLGYCELHSSGPTLPDPLNPQENGNNGNNHNQGGNQENPPHPNDDDDISKPPDWLQ